MGGERRLQRGEVEPPAGGVVGQRHLQQPGSGLGHPVEERRVHRRADHHGVARAGQHPEQLDDARPRRRSPPSPTPGRCPSSTGGRRSPASARPSSGAAIAYPVSDRSTASRSASATGAASGEVHLGHGQRQHVGRIGLPLRAAPLPQHVERVHRQFGCGNVHGHSLPYGRPRSLTGRPRPRVSRCPRRRRPPAWPPAAAAAGPRRGTGLRTAAPRRAARRRRSG